jgi:1-deoxy-D-xylulose-5-phosphate synthase
MDRYPILDTINSLEDFRRLPESKLPALAAQIRQYMVENVARCGGHLASSLGAVELTIAMHRAFDSPTDRLIFDVGHQSYAHKILTGRREAFCTLRQENGISGFPKREESEHDPFNTGHASTAISAALGMARAKRLLGEDGVAVALVGDGALTGGLAFEGLNDAGQADVPLVVIINDNEMSISPNVGALHRSLVNMRVSPGYVRFKRFLVRILDTGAFGRWLSRHMENFKNRVRVF